MIDPIGAATLQKRYPVLAMLLLRVALKAIGWYLLYNVLAALLLSIWAWQVNYSVVMFVGGLYNPWITPVSLAAAVLFWQPVSLLTILLWFAAGRLMRKRGARWWMVALAGIPCASVVSAIAHAMGWKPPEL